MPQSQHPDFPDIPHHNSWPSTNLPLPGGILEGQLSLAGSPQALFRLRQGVENREPQACIDNLVREVVTVNAIGLLTGRSTLRSVLDELESCLDIVGLTGWTASILAPLLGARCVLLSRHPESRNEDGHGARALCRLCVGHLDRVPTKSPGHKSAMGHKAVVLTGRVMLELADLNIIGATSLAERAMGAARLSADPAIQQLVLQARADVLDRIGDTETATAFRAMSRGLHGQTPAPIWLHPKLWGFKQREEGALAA